MQRIVSAFAVATFLSVVAGGGQRALAQAPAPAKPVEPVYNVVSPLGDPIAGMVTMAPRPGTLAGKTVALVWNNAFKADITLPAIAESLKEKYPGIRIIPYTEMDAAIRSAERDDSSTEGATLQAVLREKRIDALISGNGG